MQQDFEDRNEAEATSVAGNRRFTYWKNRLMKPVAVLYATREGHTQQIAERVAGDLRAHGFHADVRNLRDHASSIQLSDYCAVILSASVHAGSHESEMARFVEQHRVELDQLPAALLSVTLSEAGAEMPDATPEARARFASDVQKMIDKFLDDTGWHPKWIKPVAGALLYTKYNALVKFIMRGIAQKVGAGTDTSRNYDYTDWEALDRYVDRLAEAFSRGNAEVA